MRRNPLREATNPKTSQRRSVLAWPAWMRVLAVAPAVLLLWLAVAWATVEVLPL